MARRRPYTRVVRINQIRADHVQGMGDVVFKGFQCLNSECWEFIFIRKDEIGDDFELTCPICETAIRSGDETLFFEYSTTISSAWILRANHEYQQVLHQRSDSNTRPDTGGT